MNTLKSNKTPEINSIKSETPKEIIEEIKSGVLYTNRTENDIYLQSNKWCLCEVGGNVVIHALTNITNINK